MAALTGWLLCAHTAGSAPVSGRAFPAGGASAEPEARGSLAAAPTPVDPAIATLPSARWSPPDASGRAILRLSLRGPRYSGLVRALPSFRDEDSLGGVDLSNPRDVLELIGGGAAAENFVETQR